MDDTEDLDDFALETKRGRRSFLVTYSKADVNKYPTRKAFGEMVAKHFDASFKAGNSKTKVDYWACAKESHESGEPHYHVALKMNGAKKWLAVRNAIDREEGIQLNFQGEHDNYIGAFKYINKEDTNVFVSNDHPNLENVSSPQTKHKQKSDVVINSDIPIFATSKEKLKFTGRFNTNDSMEDEMMDVRWRTFTFTHKIPEEEQIKIDPCMRCFAEFVLSSKV